MGLFRRFTLRGKLHDATRRGLRFVDISAGIYSILLQSKPDKYKRFEGVCEYTAGWVCGSVLSYMIAFAGRPESPAEEELYDVIAFAAVEIACRDNEHLGYMRGLSAEEAGSIRMSPEFVRGYADAWKEVARFLSGDNAMFFPIGFKGYRPE